MASYQEAKEGRTFLGKVTAWQRHESHARALLRPAGQSHVAGLAGTDGGRGRGADRAFLQRHGWLGLAQADALKGTLEA